MSAVTQELLGGLSVADFFAGYWQKRPLLIRAALKDFSLPVVSPEELAGLACEEDVESRLITEHPGQTPPWQLRHGPFTEADFLQLPESHWTLLVQEVNKHVPAFARLLDRFSFVPNWRLDDVMVSYASDQGGVGPHADHYDVFLIQGLGQRRWRLSYQDSGPAHLCPDLPLRVLRDFRHSEEYLLEPGDMLYLPPGVVHEGVAIGSCMTISVGFRAPNQQEMLSAYLADCLAAMDSEQFYQDPDLQPQANPGEITPQALEKVMAIIRTLPQDEQTITSWFGSFITDVRPGHYLPEPEQRIDEATFQQYLLASGEIWRSEYARFAYTVAGEQTALLYVAGEQFPLQGEMSRLAPWLCAKRVFPRDEVLSYLQISGAATLLLELYHLGAVYFQTE